MCIYYWVGHISISILILIIIMFSLLLRTWSIIAKLKLSNDPAVLQAINDQIAKLSEQVSGVVLTDEQLQEADHILTGLEQ